MRPSWRGIPLTTTSTEILSFPSTFSATQMYLPSSSGKRACLISNSFISLMYRGLLTHPVLRMWSHGERSCPFFNHFISGLGEPLASHISVMVAPSCTCRTDGPLYTILGLCGTGGKKLNYLLRNCYIICLRYWWSINQSSLGRLFIIHTVKTLIGLSKQTIQQHIF